MLKVFLSLQFKVYGYACTRITPITNIFYFYTTIIINNIQKNSFKIDVTILNAMIKGNINK